MSFLKILIFELSPIQPMHLTRSQLRCGAGVVRCVQGLWGAGISTHLSSINTVTSSSVSSIEITSLDHETGYDTMKSGSFVSEILGQWSIILILQYRYQSDPHHKHSHAIFVERKGWVQGESESAYFASAETSEIRGCLYRDESTTLTLR